MSHDIKSAERPAPDPVLTAIADYALSYEIGSALAYETAGYCLMDTLACGFQALKYPACTKLMGPVVPGATLTGRRARSGHRLRTGSDQRRLQHRRHDSLAGFQRHLAGGGVGPSFGQSRRHSRGGRLSVARRASASLVRDVLTGMIKAHEIQGVLALENSFNRVGLGSRAAGAGGLDRGRDRHARRHARADHQCGIECMDRRRRAADLPACAEHRLAQELGRRATRPAAPCAMRCLRSRARWAIPRRCPPRPGDSKTCCSRENRSYCRSRSAAT